MRWIGRSVCVGSCQHKECSLKEDGPAKFDASLDP